MGGGRKGRVDWEKDLGNVILKRILGLGMFLDVGVWWARSRFWAQGVVMG